MLRFDGTNFTALATGTTTTLNRVVNAAKTELWFLGDAGVVLRKP